MNDLQRKSEVAQRAEAPEIYDAIVLGAGISGLVAASILSRTGRVLVVDEYDQVGGNHIDRAVGNYTFDIGSFIFQDDSPLLAHFPEILPLYVPIEPSWGRLNPQGLVTKYPISINDDLIAAGPVEWMRILLSVAFSRVFSRQLNNAKDFAEYWIGARLVHRSGLGNYMKRFYGLPAEKIDIRFAEQRMLWIKEHASLKGILRRWVLTASRSKPNQQLARPREGFARLYEPAVDRLKGRGVTFRLGCKVHNLQKREGLFSLATNGAYVSATRLVSTIPLPLVQILCGMSSQAELMTVELISLFFSFAGNRGFEHSVLYNFSHQGSWKRLTVYSDFYGKEAGREFFAVEVNSDHVSGSVAKAEEDFREHAAANKLFVGDLRLEGSNSIANAYPIYTDNADIKAATIIAELRALGVESIGRQGGFDYQPTARHTTQQAETALRDSP